MEKTYCNICKEITVCRYLDCDECKKSGKECIYVCTKCGAEVEPTDTANE